MPRVSAKYGWIPDLPDFRDRMYAPRLFKDPGELPSVLTLAKQLPIFDQGNLGSCTGNALASAHLYCQYTKQLDQTGTAATSSEPFTPSRLFIYYNERWIEHTIMEDSGAMLRDGIKALHKWGVCPEDTFSQGCNWPYDIERFTERPSEDCYTFAELHQITKYERLPRSLNAMKLCLRNGKPFVFGFSVYESFESDVVQQTGIVPMPRPREGMLGGHAVIAIGYDDNRQAFEVQNSWGLSWGDQGKFWLPYQYFLDDGLSDDFWTISTVE